MITQTADAFYKGFQTLSNLWTPEEAPSSSIFPEDAQNVTIVKDYIGGTTGPKLVSFKNRHFVYKEGKSSAHTVNEYYANLVYRALGIKAPKTELYAYNLEGYPKAAILTEYIRGKTLSDYLLDCSSDQKQELYQKLRQHFVVDCLLGNWDVIGLEVDNIVVDERGDPWRVDNGGALEYRAQGAPKGTDWSNRVEEIHTMRSRCYNPQTAEVFEDMPISDIVEQIRELNTKRETITEFLPDRIAQVITSRLDYLLQEAAF